MDDKILPSIPVDGESNNNSFALNHANYKGRDIFYFYLSLLSRFVKGRHIFLPKMIGSSILMDGNISSSIPKDGNIAPSIGIDNQS